MQSLLSLTILIPLLPLASPCGEVKVHGAGAFLMRSMRPDTQRIIGGQKAPLGAWPWQVLIKYKDYTDGNSYLCGGSIISNRHVLTAAHCTMTMDIKDPTKIFMGVSNGNPEPGEGTVVHATKKLVHPKYSSNEEINPSQEYDISLITFFPNITFTDYMAPVCLPGPNHTIHDFGFVTGFGAFNRGTKVIQQGSDYLRQTAMPIVDEESCKDKWQNDLVAYGGGFTIHEDTQICAGAVGHGSAQGDSGGPFVQQHSDGRWFQIGVVSFGINDGKGYYDQALAPGIYTRVSSFCDWISESTGGDAECTYVSSRSHNEFSLIPVILSLLYILL